MSDSEHSFGWVSLPKQPPDDSDTDDTISDKMSPPRSDIVVKMESDMSHIKSEVDISNDSETDSRSLRVSNDTHLALNIKEEPCEGSHIEKLKTFFENKQEVRPIKSVKENFAFDQEDLWLLQCPSNVDINLLLGVKILENKNKIKIPNSKFECINMGENFDQNVTLLVPPVDKKSHGSVSEYKIKGKFIIREKMKSSFEFPNEEDEMVDVRFPDNLKIRHPLFGVNFKKEIKLSKGVLEKLTNPTKRNEKEQTRTKRKRKASESFHIEKTEKNTRKKIKIEQEEMWENEIMIEKNLFEIPVLQKRKKTKTK